MPITSTNIQTEEVGYSLAGYYVLGKLEALESACNPSTQEVGRVNWVQGHALLHSQCEVIWGYVRLWPSQKKEEKGRSLTDLKGKGKLKENPHILPPRLQDFKQTPPSLFCLWCLLHAFVPSDLQQAQLHLWWQSRSQSNTWSSSHLAGEDWDDIRTQNPCFPPSDWVSRSSIVNNFTFTVCIK